VILARVETPGPVAPPEIGTNETARAAFYESTGYQAFLQNRRTYPAAEKADGILSAEDVEPGDYRLFVAIGEMPDTPPPIRGKVIMEGSVPVAVPSDPPTGTFDAGVIDLHPTPARE
jgi:hypothetical protein